MTYIYLKKKSQNYTILKQFKQKNINLLTIDEIFRKHPIHCDF